jgi:hypothetical protein
MQAYYEANAVVTNNHLLSIQLPENIPVGRVKIAVIYEVLSPIMDKQTVTVVDFLAECRRQSLLVTDKCEQETQLWLESVADNEGWE